VTEYFFIFRVLQGATTKLDFSQQHARKASVRPSQKATTRASASGVQSQPGQDIRYKTVPRPDTVMSMLLGTRLPRRGSMPPGSSASSLKRLM